jgi:hypothetical protein
MNMLWVKKRVYLEGPDERALARSIGTFAEALRARSGTILKLQHQPSVSSRRVAKISYTLPIAQN